MTLMEKAKHARLTVDTKSAVGVVPRRLFGSFVEHLGRSIYSGIFEPDHPLADEDGFRTDVIELVKELGVTTIRYPGGNFVSGYDWEDGVGPVEQRPPRLDLAWHSLEPNTFGLHEMFKWLQKIGGNELMEAINLGTRGLPEALDLLEYANVPRGSKYAEMRRGNGREKPFDIRFWCLGNEMDGEWQLGHKSATEYGRLAAKVAAGMRQIDPSIELAVCGSSSHNSPTFGSWEAAVLNETFDMVDFISCHAYYHLQNNDLGSFLASGDDMNRFIREVASTIQMVKKEKKSSHDVRISFDEWNVWYFDDDPSKSPSGIGNWPVAPPLLEDHYSVLDAVVVGDLLISLLKNVDTVQSASLAQLVNVIAPIMTVPQGPAWRQTTFWPFSLTASLTKDSVVRGTRMECETYSSQEYGEADVVDSVTVERADGTIVVFAVNRNTEGPTELKIEVPTTEISSVRARVITDQDIFAKNSLDDPLRVQPQDNTSLRAEGNVVTVELPKISWNVIEIMRQGKGA